MIVQRIGLERPLALVLPQEVHHSDAAPRDGAGEQNRVMKVVSWASYVAI